MNALIFAAWLTFAGEPPKPAPEPPKEEAKAADELPFRVLGCNFQGVCFVPAPDLADVVERLRKAEAERDTARKGVCPVPGFKKEHGA